MFRLFGLLLVVLLSSYSLSSRAGLDEVRAECTKIGFKVESDKRSDCVLALTEQMSLDMLSTNESFKKAFPIGRLDNIAINGATCNGLSFTNPVYKGASIKLDGHNRLGPKSISITKVNNKSLVETILFVITPFLFLLILFILSNKARKYFS